MEVFFCPFDCFVHHIDKKVQIYCGTSQKSVKICFRFIKAMHRRNNSTVETISPQHHPSKKQTLRYVMNGASIVTDLVGFSSGSDTTQGIAALLCAGISDCRSANANCRPLTSKDCKSKRISHVFCFFIIYHEKAYNAYKVFLEHQKPSWLGGNK